MVSSSTTISASYVSKRSRSPEQSTQKKITIKVKTQQDGGEDIFKIGVTANLKKLMDAYCVKRNFEKGTVRFVYNQKELKPRNTAAQLKMKDGDFVDILTEQGGG